MLFLRADFNMEDIKLDTLESFSVMTVTKLSDLEIHTVRQLYARLKSNPNELENYLELSQEEFADLRKRTQELIREQFPQDDVPRIYPQVNKRGVAVHRLRR